VLPVQEVQEPGSGLNELWLEPALHWHTTSSAVPEHAVTCVCVSKTHGVQVSQLERSALEYVPATQKVQTEPAPSSTPELPATGGLRCEKPALQRHVTVSPGPLPSQSVPGIGVCVRALQTEQLEHAGSPARAYWPTEQATHELAPAAEDKVP